MGPRSATGPANVPSHHMRCTVDQRALGERILPGAMVDVGFSEVNVDVLALAATHFPDEGRRDRVGPRDGRGRAADFEPGRADGIHAGERHLPAQFFAVEASLLQDSINYLQKVVMVVDRLVHLHCSHSHQRDRSLP